MSHRSDLLVRLFDAVETIMMKQDKLQQLDQLIDRLERRLTRTFNAWRKAKQRRKWMAEKTFTNMKLAEEMVQSTKVDIATEDFLEIPKALRREVKLSDEQAAAELRREIAERKKAKARGRIAKMKAKQAGDLKKMPLQGKEALEFIKKKAPAVSIEA